ncbi:MAG: vancomycin resistance protein YoaR, partial [Polyangiales bacterium]
GRGHNVRRAAELLHQTIIAPHGTLSFNEAVGARTRANGFRRAMVIDSGELVPGMGGGVCQVASTLYAAALRAGLEVVDARPHSRPSSYIPMGLDATVSYPNLDLVLSNPFDFPIQVLSHASEGVMLVELIGQARPIAASVRRRVLSRQAFGERTVEDPALLIGTREVTQSGIRGARVQVTRTLTDENGASREERNVIRYPPTDEIVHVGTQMPAGLARLAASMQSML